MPAPGTNQFLPFGTAGGAFVLTQAQWQANTERPTGKGPGIVPKEFFNKALRQPTAMAAAIGQFIAEAGYNALDDGNITNLKASFAAAIAASLASANFLSVSNFQGGAQQLAGDGYQVFPGGLILQWKHGHIPGSSGGTLVYPMAFPNACFGVFLTQNDNGTLAQTPPAAKNITLSQCGIDCKDSGDSIDVFGLMLGY